MHIRKTTAFAVGLFAAASLVAINAHAKLEAIMLADNSSAGGVINITDKGYTGTVDSFDQNSGLLRVKDGAGNVTAYKVTGDTTVTKKGNTATAKDISSGDSVTVRLKTVTTTNELSSVEIS